MTWVTTYTDRPPESVPDPQEINKMRKIYEECYWKYIDAKTWDDALYWKNQMLAQVNMNLDPRKDGKSWVEERINHDRENRVLWGYGIIGMVLFASLFVVIPILVSTGVMR